MNFATRLVAGTLLVLVLTVAVLLWSAERSLRHDLENDVASTLEREARLIREALPADSDAWAETVQRLARENGRRITLVDSSGRVRADSDFPSGLPPAREPSRPSRGPRRAGRKRRARHPTQRDGGPAAALCRRARRTGRGAGRDQPDSGGRDRPERPARGRRRRAARARGGHAVRRHRGTVHRRAAHRHLGRRARDRRGLASPVSPLRHSRHRCPGPGPPPDAPAARRPLRRAAPGAGRDGGPGRIHGRGGHRGRRAGAHRDGQPGRAPAAGLRRRPILCPTCGSCSGSRRRGRSWTRCSTASRWRTGSSRWTSAPSS